LHVTSVSSPAFSAFARDAGGIFMQRLGQLLQRGLLFIVDVGALVLSESMHKEPTITAARRDDGAETPALSVTKARDTLLQQSATKISFVQAMPHLVDGASHNAASDNLCFRAQRLNVRVL